MNSLWFRNGLRLIFLFFFQVLVLKQVHLNWGSFNFISIMIIPLWIMLVPIQSPKWLLVVGGFLVGLGVDWFYDSPGVHASAATFVGFIRPFVLQYIEPRGGYNRVPIPSKFHLGLNWFVTYASVMVFAYLLFYFSMEVFTPSLLGTILVKTVFSFILSILLVLLYMFIFDPK